MKEKLIKLWERKERHLRHIKNLEDKKIVFHQCFGALLLAIDMDRSLEYELAKLWMEEWKDRLEQQIYKNED